MRVYDLIVVGGGPIGSLTASLVRKLHPEKRILILEKEKHPRHHVGETTIPSWLPVLERAGVLGPIEAAGTTPKLGGFFHWGVAGDNAWTIDFHDPTTGRPYRGAFQVDRGAFDQLLFEHARTLGCEAIESARVESVSSGPPFQVTWSREGTTEHATADWIVDASGQAKTLARLWSLEVEPFDDMDNFAVWGYWANSEVWHQDPVAPEARWTYIATCDDGWLWHIPISSELVSVGLVTQSQALPRGGTDALEPFYRRNVESAHGIAPLLERAELVQHPLASARLLVARDWSYRCKQLCGPGWMLAGDAALFVDPIFSTGLLIGVTGASMAANVLHTAWTDEAVDMPLLLESYQEAYTDIGLSFHRLASVWYASNQKTQSAYWTARRQRMRAGGDPGRESEHESFIRLCLGGAVNPVEGAIENPTKQRELDRFDVNIIADNVLGKGNDMEGNLLRQELRRRNDERFRTLLPCTIVLGACVARQRQSYFTDREMDHWQKVAYVELRAEGSSDEFDRLVLPILAWLPDSIAAVFDGAASLASVVRKVCAGTQAFSRDRYVRWQSVFQQVLQLDLRGWLQISGDPVLTDAAADMRAIFERDPAWKARIDWTGDSVTLTSDEGRVSLTPAGGPSFVSTRGTSVSYQGSQLAPAVDRFIRTLTPEIERVERSVPDLWATVMPQLGGLGL